MQEEERSQQDKTESAHLASTFKDKGKRKLTPNEAIGASLKKQQKQIEFTCYFCNKGGHKRINCTKYHPWRAKEGTSFALIYSKVNIASVPRHTRRIDSGATTHKSVFI